MPDQVLNTKFNSMWNEAETSLREGTYNADSVPCHGDPRWGLSLVIPIDGAIRDTIADDLDPIAESLSPHHFTYLPENLHSTVRSLEGYQEDVPQRQAAHYFDRVESALKNCAPIEIELLGLGGSKGGLFVCGYPSDGLVQLRIRLHELGAVEGPQAFPSNDYANMRDIAHVSVAVFQAPVVPEPSILNIVSERREKHYGTVRPTTLDLVRYDLAHGQIRMNRLASIDCSR